MITRSLSLIMPHRHSRKRLVLTSSQWLQLLVGAMPSSCTRGRTLQRYFSCMQKLMQDELQNHRIRANRHFAGLYYHRPRAVTIPLIHFMIRFALAFITDPSLSLSLSLRGPGTRGALYFWRRPGSAAGGEFEDDERPPTGVGLTPIVSHLLDWRVVQEWRMHMHAFAWWSSKSLLEAIVVVAAVTCVHLALAA
jgi:hypothetical protein